MYLINYITAVIVSLSLSCTVQGAVIYERRQATGVTSYSISQKALVLTKGKTITVGVIVN
jgi:hypothetical protein